MASDLFAALQKAAAAYQAQQKASAAPDRAEPTSESLKARAMRLVDDSLRAAERATGPALKSKHLEAAERAVRLAGAVEPMTPQQEAAPTFVVEFSGASADDDGDALEVRAEPEAEGALPH